jgi:hypothetical protein
MTGEAKLNYSDGIAAARTLIALEANATALQRRLPEGWELAPYAGDDLRGKSLRGANLLLPFHEVFAVRNGAASPGSVQQVSYVVFISQARHRLTGTLGHIHWLSYTEDPASVPGKYRDAKLARISRSQTFTKKNRADTRVRETFSAVAESGEIHLSLGYRQGELVMWVTADTPNLSLYAASDPTIERWYQEDQVIDIARSDPMDVNAVTHLELTAKGELTDVFDGTERVVAVVAQRPYMRHVYVP